VLAALILIALSALAGARTEGSLAPAALIESEAHAAGACSLGTAAGPVQHVISIQFDNTHLSRDNPNVPSDLEQMPHLLSFLKDNGVVLTNHHTPLIAHTSEDVLTALTGVYPSRHGVAIGQNSYQYYVGGSPASFTNAFTYWTDTISDGTYNMIGEPPIAAKPTGTNAPAPWVPYTRAGCNVGEVAVANQVLENANVNSKSAPNDIANIYGVRSPEAQESSAQRSADFEGIAVHCSQSDSVATGLCSSANNGRPDLLPDEPGGYSGFSAVYGHKYLAPLISPNGPLTDLSGGVIKNSSGNLGFPGLERMTARISLSYVAAMQEHGIPVTYAYISDAHDLASASTRTALGPGEQAYVQQLKASDDAFAKFFARLQADGITPANTLFVFTSDEGDHFTGGPPNDPSCTGVTLDDSQNPPVVTPGNYCMYTKTPANPTTPPGPPFGEVLIGLDGLLSQEQDLNNYSFTVGNDTAPGIYLNGQPASTDPATRIFERATGALTVTNPLTNKVEIMAQYLADPVEMSLLHLVTADPSRTPTFMLFARPDYYVGATCAGGFNSKPPPVYSPACVLEKPAIAWLHGNIQPDVTTTWLGMAGPGIKHVGVDGATWSDHTDIRPTIMALLGLRDDYQHDGRVLLEDLNSQVLPVSMQSSLFLSLARTYKQLNAPVGQFSLATLKLATAGIRSGNGADDSTYTATDSTLTQLGITRDNLASQMLATLEGAEFGGTSINASQAQALISSGWALLRKLSDVTGGTGFQVDFRSSQPGQGEVLFGPGPGCNGLVMVATQDEGAGTTEHHVTVTGNDLPSTAGNIGITPGATYSYETVTVGLGGQQTDDNQGHCYTVTIPGP
jgi:arylsulfatase A-like enzyme